MPKTKQPTSARSAKSGQFVTAATAKRRPATTVVEGRKKKSQRFRLMADESGHEYAIPVEMADEFYRWVRWTMQYEEDDYDGYDFEGCRIEGGFDFADPREGGRPVPMPFKETKT